MDTLERLNQAMAYIEANLDGEIDFQEVERLALCSEYHFRRMFSYLVGQPLSEYLRRRRLSLAALELRRGAAVIDLAFKYGYTSADAFSRAFSALHGLLPSMARSGEHPIKAYPPITFRFVIKGDQEMNYRIVEKPAFRVVGVMKRVALIYRGVNPEIVALASTLDGEKIALLKSLSNVEPAGMISASVNINEGWAEGSQLDHYIGVATTLEAPSGLASLDVSAGVWGVFESVGPFPETLQNTWERIYTEWFPTSGYQLAPGPAIVWNESPDTSSPTYHSEIWTPIVKR